MATHLKHIGVDVEESKDMEESRFPKGWDEDRVKRVLAHYESQSEDEAMAEDEAAWEDSSHTFLDSTSPYIP